MSLSHKDYSASSALTRAESFFKEAVQVPRVPSCPLLDTCGIAASFPFKEQLNDLSNLAQQEWSPAL
jgi:hypothetical protein